MKKTLPAFLLLLFLLTACTAAAPGEPVPLQVQYTDAARPWLVDLQDCAARQNTVLLLEPRPADFFDASVDLAIRIEEPDILSQPAYSIGEEEIVLIVHPANPVALIDSNTARRLFAGQTTNWRELGGPDLPIQVWVYAPGEDIQEAFETAIMQGMPVTSTARLAPSIEAMVAAIEADSAALGLLPSRQVPATLRRLNLPPETREVLTVPVLALPGPEPPETLTSILLCLQR
jgi:hypothetical protein